MRSPSIASWSDPALQVLGRSRVWALGPPPRFPSFHRVFAATPPLLPAMRTDDADCCVSLSAEAFFRRDGSTVGRLPLLLPSLLFLSLPASSEQGSGVVVASRPHDAALRAFKRLSTHRCACPRRSPSWCLLHSPTWVLLPSSSFSPSIFDAWKDFFAGILIRRCCLGAPFLSAYRRRA